MIVYTAQIEVPDNATYAEIEEAKLAAEWKVKDKRTFVERMADTDIEGKCASCKWFVQCGFRARTYGNCLNPNSAVKVKKGRARTQTCKAYQKRL